MKNYFILLVVISMFAQNSSTYCQQTQNPIENVETYLNMDTSLGVIFCGKLTKLVFDAALNNSVSVYKSSTLASDQKLEKEQIIDHASMNYVVEMPSDVNDPSSAIIDTIVRIPIYFRQINGFYFSIQWQLQPDGYLYSGTPNAFALAYNSASDNDSIKMLPLLWIRFTDLKKLLAAPEYHQLQEALFLHIYPKVDFCRYGIFKAPKKNTASDIKRMATQIFFFNTRISTNLDTAEWQGMSKQLIEDAIKDRILIYRYDSMNFGEKVTIEEILRGCVSTSEAQIEVSPGVWVDTVLISRFDIFKISGIAISEQWLMDYKQNQIIGLITGIANYYDYIILGEYSGKEIPFYIPFKHIEKAFGKTKQLTISSILFDSLVKNYLQ